MGDQMSIFREESSTMFPDRFSSFSETPWENAANGREAEFSGGAASFFWKNHYYDAWFPVPKEIHSILDSSPDKPFLFGIYIHNEGDCDVYANCFSTYMLDPVQLVLWCTREVDPKKNFIHHLLLKKVTPEGEFVGEAPFDFDSPQDLECLVKIRPRCLPKAPPCAEEPQEINRDLKTLFYCIQNDQFMAYPPSIQSLLNKSDAPLRFAIYDRKHWPELFGGGYREYIIDPVELTQISVAWKQARPMVMVAQQVAKLDDNSKLLSIGDAKRMGFSYNLPQKYIDAAYTRVYPQDMLNALGTYAIPGVDVYYYILYACHLLVDDPGSYLDQYVPYFARENENWQITGAILRPDPEAPDVVMQYFEGPYKAVRQLKNNIQYNQVVSNFSLLGQGFMGKREFDGWGMKREASAKETLEICKKFQQHKFVSRSQFKRATFLRRFTSITPITT